MIAHKKIEIFCGSGGVGKTTVSTSRAIHLANNGLNVLLITIDPAKRLKQLLNIEENHLGELTKIINEDIIDKNKSLTALLLSPKKTFQRILGDKINNNIIKSLTSPHGGMDEIAAVLEIQHHLNTNKFDVIVLDTPPGKHFIDFLESSKKNSFFL